MADLTWGFLPKSQVDPELIEEAISQAVEDHNNDPDSHLEAGQSLQSHRAAEIIDHVVGSVLADKLSHREDIITLMMNTLDSWTTDGSVFVNEVATVQLFAEDGDATLSRMRGVINSGGNWLNYDHDMLFQTVCWLEGEGAYQARFGLGHYNPDGFGFVIVAGELRGFWKEGTFDEVTGVLSVDFTKLTVFRAQYVAEEGKVDYYINENYLATINAPDIPADFDGYEPLIYHEIKGTGTFFVSDIVRSVMVSRRID